MKSSTRSNKNKGNFIHTRIARIGAPTLIDMKQYFNFCFILANKNRGEATNAVIPQSQSFTHIEMTREIKIKIVASQYVFCTPKNTPVVISFVFLSPSMSGIVVFMKTPPTAKKYGSA